MTITEITAPPLERRDLGALTDEALAEAWGTADVDDPAVFAAFLAEFDQRAAAERMSAAQERRKRAEQQLQSEWYDAMHAQRMAAEAYCQGWLLNPEARRLNAIAEETGKVAVSEWQLWTGPARLVEKYGSEEILAFFGDHPRLTLAEYKRQRSRAGRLQREEWRDRDEKEASNGMARDEPGPLRRDETAAQAPEAGPGGAVDRGRPVPAGSDGTGSQRDGRPAGPVQRDGLEGADMGVIHAARVVARVAEASQRAAANGGWGTPRPAAPEAVAPLPPGITGAIVLNDARDFAATILYATDEQLDALVLACAVTHTIRSFTTLPRLLATAPEKQSGKSTLLNIVAMLANNAWDPDPTSFALRSKFNERETPTPIFDEISDVYGRSGLRSGGKDLNTILKKGYQNTAQLSLSRDGTSVDVPCYCVAAAGGLRNAVPDDVWDRCIVWKCRPVPEGIDLRDSLDDDTKAFGKNHNERIHQWARGAEQEIKDAFRTFRKPHRKMRSRLRQIWGPLYAVALAAGEDWPQRCMAAFRVMALDASDVPVLSGPQMVLRDAAALFARTGAERLFAADIRDYLWSLPDVELYEKLTPRGLAQLMTDALGPTTSMDIGEARARGYHARPVLAAWKRLEAQLEPVLEDEEEEDELDTFFEVTEITEDDCIGAGSTEITEVTDNLAPLDMKP